MFLDIRRYSLTMAAGLIISEPWNKSATIVLYFLPCLCASCTKVCPEKDVSTYEIPAVTGVGDRKTGTGYFGDCRRGLLMIESFQKITRADKYPCPAASESGPGEIFCAEQGRNAQKVQKYRGRRVARQRKPSAAQLHIKNFRFIEV